MLSVFPSLLSYAEVSPLLIRLCLGIVFVIFAVKSMHSLFRPEAAAYNNVTYAKIVAVIEFISGLLIILGVRTQVAALIIAIDLIIRLILKIRHREFLTDGVNYYLILLVMAVSLLLTGAGLWAFDLPL